MRYLLILLALSSSPSLASNPIAHLDEWKSTCEYGGYFINFDIHSDLLNRRWAVIVDETTLDYVIPDFMTDGPLARWTKEEASESKERCWGSLNNLAYSIEYAADKSWIDGFRVYHKNPAKDSIDSFQKWVRGGDIAVFDRFNNGQMKYGFEVFEGRNLMTYPYPNWLHL